MIDKKTAAHWLSVILLAALVIGIVLGVVALAHGATTKHGNSLGVVITQSNPNSYLAGNVTNVAFAGSPKNYGVDVRVQPMGAFMLYTQEVLFCGDPSTMFAGKHNPMLLVYETRDHHTVEGIGCHELRGVHDIVSEKIQ
jgi:hypothetical protein